MSCIIASNTLRYNCAKFTIYTIHKIFSDACIATRPIIAKGTATAPGNSESMIAGGARSSIGVTLYAICDGTSTSSTMLVIHIISNLAILTISTWSVTKST